MKKELSEIKQGILLTMYLRGARKITIQTDDLVQIDKPDHFGCTHYGGNIPFLTEELSLRELKENPSSPKNETFMLADLIREYCPKYSYVLDMINDSSGR